MGTEMNEARMRMARVPNGAELVHNKISAAPGFWIGNVIVMAGVPAIMQAMLDEVAPKLKTGTQMLSESIRADLREGDIGTELGEVAKAHPGVTHRQLSVFRRQARAEHQCRDARARSAEARRSQGGGGGYAAKGAGDALARALLLEQKHLSELLMLLEQKTSRPNTQRQQLPPATGVPFSRCQTTHVRGPLRPDADAKRKALRRRINGQYIDYHTNDIMSSTKFMIWISEL